MLKKRRQSVLQAKEGKPPSYTRPSVILTNAQELERVMREDIAKLNAARGHRFGFLDILDANTHASSERVAGSASAASAARDLGRCASRASTAMSSLRQELERQELSIEVSTGLPSWVQESIQEGDLSDYSIGGAFTRRASYDRPNPPECVMPDIDYGSFERRITAHMINVASEVADRELTITIDEAQLMAYAKNMPTVTPKDPPNHSPNMARKNRNSVWPKKPLPVHMRPKEE